MSKNDEKLAKNKQTDEEDIGEYEKDIADIAEQITPFVEMVVPKIIEYQKVRVPIIKRGQNINFIVMMTILLSISILAYYKTIDGSAATGLIGAIIGYVFGGLYNQKER